MHRIDSPDATQDHLFTEGDPTVPVDATSVTAEWLNAVQEEPSHVIEQAGLTLNKADNTQLYQAILTLIAAHAPTPGSATTSAQGIVELATDAEAIAGTDTVRAVTPHALAAALAAAIVAAPTVDNGYIGAGAMVPAITDGAAMAVVEDATNHLTRNVMSFQGSTKDTHSFFNFCLPENWNGGTIKAKVLWKGAAGCSAGDNVRFYMACAAVSDGDALDLALGAAVNIDDTVETDATKLRTSAASAAMTPSGAPVAGDWLRFRLSRDYDYGASPMSEAAEVLGVVLQFGITGNIAAWA